MDNDDSLSLYQADLLRHDLLDPLEEVRLLRRASLGEQQAIDDLVTANQRLVMSVARRYYHSGMTGDLDLMDLVQYGNLGLLEAIAKFDLSRGYRFSTYAMHWIRAYIRRLGLMQGHSNPRTARDGDLIARVSSARSRLYNLLRRNPTPGEISVYTGISVRRVVRAIPMIPAAVSLDQSQSGEDDLTVGDGLQSDSDTAGLAEHQLNLERMGELLAGLPDLDRQVLTLRFGLDPDLGPCTYAAIAGLLSISRNRVQSIERRALERMRQDLDPDS